MMAGPAGPPPPPSTPAWLLLVARWIDKNPRLCAVGVASIPLIAGWSLLESTMGGASDSLFSPGWRQERFVAQSGISRSLPPEMVRQNEQRKAQLQALFDGLEHKTRDDKLADATDALFKFTQGEGAMRLSSKR